MLNPTDDLDNQDEAETLDSVRRGLADVDAGRTQSLVEVFERLKAGYAVD